MQTPKGFPRGDIGDMFVCWDPLLWAAIDKFQASSDRLKGLCLFKAVMMEIVGYERRPSMYSNVVESLPVIAALILGDRCGGSLGRCDLMLQ
jgi:hypothetical protein